MDGSGEVSYILNNREEVGAPGVKGGRSVGRAVKALCNNGEFSKEFP